MKTKKDKLKSAALLNLIAGYILTTAFIILMTLNIQPDEELVVSLDFVEENNTVIEEEPVVFVPVPTLPQVNYVDHLNGVVLDGDDRTYTAVVRDDVIYDINTPDVKDVYNRDINRHTNRGIVDYGIDHERSNRVDGGFVGRRDRDHRVDRIRDDIDVGLLDRRLAELDIVDDNAVIDVDRVIREDQIGLEDRDKSIDFGGLTVARDNDDVELGDVDDIGIDFDGEGKGYGVGKGGQLYAYNYPSQGVGAGVGTSAVGAGSGAGAGLGAGIGEGVLNGETVPTLGGIGTYSSVPVITPGTGDDTDSDGLSAAVEAALGTDPTKSDSDGDGYVDGAEITAGYNPQDARSNPGNPGTESSPALGGTGGLVGGAGAGGAAGLVTGMVTEKMGIGTGPGCAEHGGDCTGHHGHGGHGNYDHLPKDGALHIMMHVDGSGSILNTRKQLDIMKDTILKTSLLPYYNNDEDLYNRRVTIVSSSGERTLKFFTEAAKKENVLAIAFQDEAQPAYHLPNFNKKPEDHYIDDIGKLKASLNGYGGVYRGVMFQVDRGKTFAKSFKEFVGNAFRGEGYLKSNNLKKYYRDNNTHHIRNKDGVVFSDEYHAKDAGDPQYYLDLIFNASKKVGLDLDIYGAGLKDGRYNKE